MSELTEPLWAVLSERGCEVIGVAYDEAVRIERQLRSDGVHGLCIITVEAARRVAGVENNVARGNISAVRPAASGVQTTRRKRSVQSGKPVR